MKAGRKDASRSNPFPLRIRLEPDRSGQGLTYAMAVIGGLLFGLFKLNLRWGFRHGAIIYLLDTVVYAVVVYGLVQYRWWAHLLTSALVGSVLLWCCADLLRLSFSLRYPGWYSAVPLVGESLLGIGIVAVVAGVLLAVLANYRLAFMQD